MQTYIQSWQSFYPTDTNTHLHTGPPAVELTQMKKLSCVQLQTHTRPYTSISSSCDKSEKSAAEWGVFAVQGRGDKLYREKAVTFLPLVNDFPFMKLREGCISIQPHWSLRDSIGKWPAVIKQCGGKKHRGIFWGKADIFFYCVELHKSQQITKGKTYQKYSTTPSVLQNSRAWGMTHPTFVSLRNGPLIDGIPGTLALVEVFNAMLFVCLFVCLVLKKQMACVRQREVEQRKRQTEWKRWVLFTRSGV